MNVFVACQNEFGFCFGGKRSTRAAVHFFDRPTPHLAMKTLLYLMHFMKLILLLYYGTTELLIFVMLFFLPVDSRQLPHPSSLLLGPTLLGGGTSGWVQVVLADTSQEITPTVLRVGLSERMPNTVVSRSSSNWDPPHTRVNSLISVIFSIAPFVLRSFPTGSRRRHCSISVIGGYVLLVLCCCWVRREVPAICTVAAVVPRRVVRCSVTHFRFRARPWHKRSDDQSARDAGFNDELIKRRWWIWFLHRTSLVSGTVKSRGPIFARRWPHWHWGVESARLWKAGRAWVEDIRCRLVSFHFRGRVGLWHSGFEGVWEAFSIRRFQRRNQRRLLPAILSV